MQIYGQNEKKTTKQLSFDRVKQQMGMIFWSLIDFQWKITYIQLKIIHQFAGSRVHLPPNKRLWL